MNAAESGNRNYLAEIDALINANDELVRRLEKLGYPRES
jgi:hypothetical protein